MFKSEYIDLAIGLAVVFFLTSLIVSGLNEGLQWSFRVRAKFLWSYLHDLADPDRHKTLPSGFLGILHLWRGDDQRPTVRSATIADAPPQPAPFPADPATPIPPGDTMRCVANALDPLDVPDVAGKVKKKTTIQNIPAGSLAQAFLEVFADIGKQQLAAELLKLARSYAGTADADKDATLRPLVALLVPDGASTPPATGATGTQPPAVDQQVATREILQAYMDAATDPSSADDPVPAFENALRALPGISVPPSLKGAATAYATTLRSRTADAASVTDQALVEAADNMAGSLARTFAQGFSRERIAIALDRLKNAPLGPTARRLWEAAEGDIDKFRTTLEGYFDGEMKRLSGVYRRSIRVVMVGLAIIVAVACNVDAVGLARNLWRNPDGRAALVAQADALTSPSTGGAASGSPANPDLAKIQDECKKAAPPDDAVINNPEDAAKAFNDVRHCVTDALNAQSGLDVIDNALWVSPSGWYHQWFTGEGDWLLHLLGVAATAVALVLGAPFWFDILKRLTGIRRTTQA
jgi:hypothetical protein